METLVAQLLMQRASQPALPATGRRPTGDRNAYARQAFLQQDMANDPIEVDAGGSFRNHVPVRSSSVSDMPQPSTPFANAQDATGSAAQRAVDALHTGGGYVADAASAAAAPMPLAALISQLRRR